MLGIREQIELAHTYAIIGQIHGLLEAWLGETEPPVAEVFDRGDWERLGQSQRIRIIELFDQIPARHVHEAILHAKQGEERSGVPMFAHGGSYWPVFFYHLMIADMDGRNSRELLPKILQRNPKFVVIGV